MNKIQQQANLTQSPEDVEKLLMRFDFDELINSLSLSEIIRIYNLAFGTKDEEVAFTMHFVGGLSEQLFKKSILEVLVGHIF